MYSERDVNSKPIIHKYGQNFTSLISRYCQGRVPRSCDHGIFNESHGRPCTLLESYVSSGDFVTLELKNTETTVLRWGPKIYSYYFRRIRKLICMISLVADHCNSNYATNSLTYNKTEQQSEQSMNVIVNSIAVQWITLTKEHSVVLRIYLCLAEVERPI